MTSARSSTKRSPGCRNGTRPPSLLCDLEGRTYEEAARLLGRPVGTIKSRLARGREHLRGRMIRRGVAPSVVASAGFLAAGVCAIGGGHALDRRDGPDGRATRRGLRGERCDARRCLHPHGWSVQNHVPVPTQADRRRHPDRLRRLLPADDPRPIEPGRTRPGRRPRPSRPRETARSRRRRRRPPRSRKGPSRPGPTGLDARPASPWQTVVRIKVVGDHQTGFATGTIIASSPRGVGDPHLAHEFPREETGTEAGTCRTGSSSTCSNQSRVRCRHNSTTIPQLRWGAGRLRLPEGHRPGPGPTGSSIACVEDRPAARGSPAPA